MAVASLVLLEFVARTSVVALLAGGLLALFRLRRGAVLHAVWTSVLVFIVAWPVLRMLAPSVEVPIGDFSMTVPIMVAVAAPIDAGTTMGWPMVIVAGYATVACAFVVRMAVGAVGARRVRRESMPVGLPGVRESAAVDVPCAIGLLRPEIILPLTWRSWGAAKLAGVLAHERAHVQRRDPLTIVLARMTRAVLWGHPLSWWLERRITSAAEYAADDRAAQVVGAREYAGVLMEVAASARRARRLKWSGVAMAGSSRLGARIERIIEGDSMRKISWIRGSLFAAGLAGVFVTVLAFQFMPTSASAAADARQMLGGPVVVQAESPTGARPVAAAREPAASPSAPRPGRETFRAKATLAPVASVTSPQSPGQGISYPLVVARRNPRYTREAMQAKIQGEVHVEAVVLADGFVGDVRVVKSLDQEFGLDQSAVDAARRWQFQPGMTTAGTPVPVKVTIVLEFRLR